MTVAANPRESRVAILEEILSLGERNDRATTRLEHDDLFAKATEFETADGRLTARQLLDDTIKFE